MEATTIYDDNQTTIAMMKNPIYHNRTRHVETCHHFISELVTKDNIKVEYNNTNKQVVDLFTKSLPLDKFLYLEELLEIEDF